MMEKPVVAAREPFKVDVEAGKAYFWCACGRSQKQPYCDGSHRGTTHRPVRYTAPQDLTVALCGCKQTGQPPFCDGRHVAYRAAQQTSKRMPDGKD